MTSRKSKGNISPESDFNFICETEITRRRSPAIKIGSKSEMDNAQPFFTGGKDEDVPQEVSNLEGQLRLPRIHVDNT
jgi:hypothetical protein